MSGTVRISVRREYVFERAYEVLRLSTLKIRYTTLGEDWTFYSFSTNKPSTFLPVISFYGNTELLRAVLYPLTTTPI